MNFSATNCDIYIGNEAGKELLSKIRNAKESVRIVSPYLSPVLVSELIRLRKKNVEVELITSDDIEDFSRPEEQVINKLIIQNREVNDEAVKKREHWRFISTVLSFVLVGLIISLIALIYYYRNFQLVIGFVPIVLIGLSIGYLRRRIADKRIYTYWYSKLFPFKVFVSNYNSEIGGSFIHSKIYLIDDQVAFLGSLNFTLSGTKYNYETCIKTQDPGAIMHINAEIDKLANHKSYPEKDIQIWGKQLYSEPIN